MPQTLEARVEQSGPSSSVAIVRTHRLPVDRPLDKGGTDTGPLGGEYLLVALGGCFMSNLLAAIRARAAKSGDGEDVTSGDVKDVSVALTAVLDGQPARVVSISMTVGATGVERDMLEKLVDIAGRGCVVTNTLKLAVPIAVICEARAAGAAAL